MTTVDLAGRRILVVEDEPLLAMDIVDQVQDHGGVVLGPAVSLDEGIEMLRAEKPDACVLNIRLGGQMVYPLADELLETRVPFIFASGETRTSIPGKYADVPLHAKPLDMVAAAAALMALDAD